MGTSVTQALQMRRHLQRGDDVLAFNHSVRANIIHRQTARLVQRGLRKHIWNGVAPEGAVGQLAEVAERALAGAHSAFFAAEFV